MNRAPRPLTDAEAGVLAVLLAHDFQGVEALREQARTASATPGCECGCGTIELHAAGGQPADVLTRVPVEGTVVGPDGDPVGFVLLFVDDGMLSALEVAGFVDDALAMPSPERIEQITVDEGGG